MTDIMAGPGNKGKNVKKVNCAASTAFRSVKRGMEVSTDDMFKQLLALPQRQLQVQIAFEKNVQNLLVLWRGRMISIVLVHRHHSFPRPPG